MWPYNMDIVATYPIISVETIEPTIMYHCKYPIVSGNCYWIWLLQKLICLSNIGVFDSYVVYRSGTFLSRLELLHSYDMGWKCKGEIVLYGNVIWQFKGDMEHVHFKHDLAGNIIRFDDIWWWPNGTCHLLWEFSEDIIAYYWFHGKLHQYSNAAIY